MKNLFLLLLAASLFMVSCDKEDKDDTTATCTDGIQNQNETAIDCGGSCPACATCSDGIQNQDETGVDCGGTCAACGTCTDGVQNQGETDVDCGGPCAACPTCVTCVSSIVGSNDIVYCEDDFATQADYNNAVAAAEASGRTCN